MSFLIETLGESGAQIHFPGARHSHEMSACRQLNEMSGGRQLHKMSPRQLQEVDVSTIASKDSNSGFNRGKTSYWTNKMLFHVKPSSKNVVSRETDFVRTGRVHSNTRLVRTVIAHSNGATLL